MGGHRVDKNKHKELLKRFEIDKFLGKGSFGAAASATTGRGSPLPLSTGAVYRVKRISDGQVPAHLARFGADGSLRPWCGSCTPRRRSM